MTNLSNPILPVRQLTNSVRQLVRKGTSIQTWLSAPGPQLLIRICGFSGSCQILVISSEFPAFTGNLGNGCCAGPVSAPPDPLHLALCLHRLTVLLQPRFTTERHLRRPRSRGRHREEPAPHPSSLPGHCSLAVSFSVSSSLAWWCFMWLSVSHGNTPPFVSSLLCCPHFVKSPSIMPFSSVSCRNLDRYGCFSMDRVPAASFPVYHLWGSM